MRAVIVCGVAAACLGWWTYVPNLDSYLVTDDFQWVQGGLQFSLSDPINVSHRTHFYRPVIELYFAAMQGLFPCSARALHATSVSIHLINVGLVMVLAHMIKANPLFTAVSGLLFAVQPSAAEAVLWPSAVTTLLCATFGLLMLALDARRARAPSRTGSAAVAIAFAAALGSHESGVMMLPAALALRYARGDRVRLPVWARDYAGCICVLAVYVALAAWINSRNYVVTEGHYRLGAHIATNLLDYLVALYAGRRRLMDYALVFAVSVLLVWKGSRHVRAWYVWMVIALTPVLPFSWATSSRYLYVPCIPFAFLLAEGLLWLRTTVAAARTIPHRRTAAVAVLIAVTTFVVGRSALFTRKGVWTFDNDAAAYRTIAESMRKHRTGDVVTVERSAVERIPPLYVLPLARTAVCDSAVVLDVAEAR